MITDKQKLEFADIVIKYAKHKGWGKIEDTGLYVDFFVHIDTESYQKILAVLEDND